MENLVGRGGARNLQVPVWTHRCSLWTCLVPVWSCWDAVWACPGAMRACGGSVQGLMWGRVSLASREGFRCSTYDIRRPMMIPAVATTANLVSQGSKCANCVHVELRHLITLRLTTLSRWVSSPFVGFALCHLSQLGFQDEQGSNLGLKGQAR